MKLFSIGLSILILLATVSISTARIASDDVHIPDIIREKAEKLINSNLQPQPTQLMFLIVLLILLLVLFGTGE